MKVLLILGAVLLALVLLSLVRLGALVEYAASGLSLRLKVGPLRFTLYPPRPKKHRTESRKQKRKKEPEGPQPEKGGGPLALVRQYLPLIADAAGGLKRRLRLDTFYLDFTAAAADPAAAALMFGGSNAMIGMLWPLVEQNFNVKERRLRTRVDFSARKPSVYLYASATLTVGQALSLALRLAVKFLKLHSQSRAGAEPPATDKQKEAV